MDGPLTVHLSTSAVFLVIMVHLVHKIGDSIVNCVQLDDSVPVVPILAAHPADVAIPGVFAKETV